MADLFQASNEKVNRERMAQAADAWDAVFAFLTSSPLETTAAVKRMYTNAPPQGLTVVELLAGLADIGAELGLDQALALHRDADANRDGQVGPGLATCWVTHPKPPTVNDIITGSRGIPYICILF